MPTALGVLGYSFDGYNSLALSGARIDPKFYLEQCANASSVNPSSLIGGSGISAIYQISGMNSKLTPALRSLRGMTVCGSR